MNACRQMANQEMQKFHLSSSNLVILRTFKIKKRGLQLGEMYSCIHVLSMAAAVLPYCRNTHVT